MNNISKLLILILIVSISTPFFADSLGDFKSNVEDEEQENSQSADPGYESDDNYEDTEESNGFMDFLWQISFLIWYAHNETVFYTPFPYETSGLMKGDNFIGHDMRNDDEINYSQDKNKNYNFSLYGGGTIDEALKTYGGLLRFTGKFFNHLGPEIDYRLLYDGKDVLHNLSTGINLSFFQFDYISLDFYGKAMFFMGSLERQGISLGAKMTSYPFKPVSLEIRSGGIFLESITFAEFEVKLGIHNGPVEFFGDFYTLQSERSQLYSIGFGAGYHF